MGCTWTAPSPPTVPCVITSGQLCPPQPEKNQSQDRAKPYPRLSRPNLPTALPHRTPRPSSGGLPSSLLALGSSKAGPTTATWAPKQLASLGCLEDALMFPASTCCPSDPGCFPLTPSRLTPADSAWGPCLLPLPRDNTLAARCPTSFTLARRQQSPPITPLGPPVPCSPPLTSPP